jgi:hypothetical protein
MINLSSLTYEPYGTKAPFDGLTPIAYRPSPIVYFQKEWAFFFFAILLALYGWMLFAVGSEL